MRVPAESINKGETSPARLQPETLVGNWPLWASVSLIFQPAYLLGLLEKPFWYFSHDEAPVSDRKISFQQA